MDTMSRGPMAKHPSTRARSNTHSTAREIVLRGEHDDLLPVPDLPERQRIVKSPDGDLTLPTVWHEHVKVAWAEMWQYPLVYEAPSVDRHLMFVYIDLLQDFWERSERGRARHEIARDLRAYAELWGIGEKSRRHLQITVQQAEEAMERGRKANTKRIESSAEAYKPVWSPEDEDEGVVDAEVVTP